MMWQRLELSQLFNFPQLCPKPWPELLVRAENTHTDHGMNQVLL